MPYALPTSPNLDRSDREEILPAMTISDPGLSVEADNEGAN